MARFRVSCFYLLLLFFFLSIAIALLLLKGHAGSFILLNQYHNKTLDIYIVNFTYVGDGLFSVFLAFVLFFFIKTQRLSMVLLTSFIVSGLLAQLFKRIIDTPRPIAYFTIDQYNKFVDGVNNASAHSFPSGHTTSAFALATVLACYTNNRLLQLAYLLLAVIVGYSRIYLGQHFLTDVVGGAILGTLIALLSVKIANGVKQKRPVSFISQKNAKRDS